MIGERTRLLMYVLAIFGGNMYMKAGFCEHGNEASEFRIKRCPSYT
jgi:hypothetical protein